MFSGPAVDGRIFGGTGRTGTFYGCFDGTSCIVFMGNKQIGKFQMHDAAVVTFEAAEIINTDLPVGFNCFSAFDVSGAKRALTYGAWDCFVRDNVKILIFRKRMIFM